MQGFIPLAPCFIILSNYLHRFAHQASVHWQDVIASAINQETFGGVWRVPAPLIQTHWEARLMFILINPIIHFDILIFDVLSLQLNVLVVLTQIIPVTVLFDNTCTEPTSSSFFVSLTVSRFTLSSLEKKSTLHLWLGCHWVMHYGYSHSCLPRSRSTLRLNETPALINIQQLAPSVASSTLYKTPPKHVKTCLEHMNTTYSSPQGYYSNLVKALGKSTAPAAAQWGEVAGGGMWMSQVKADRTGA